MKRLFPKKPIRKPDIEKDDSIASDLNDFDRLYLSLVKVNYGIFYFNKLCFDNNIRSLEDIKHIKSTKEDPLKWFSVFDEDRIKTLPETAKGFNFSDLIKKNRKFDYETKLAAVGVPILSIHNIRIVKFLAEGPLSGQVFEAMLKTPEGSEIQVCLRYPKTKKQLEQFLNEAKMLAAFQHKNILKLHGVVVFGKYTDSIGLVVEFASYGNITEALPVLTVKRFCMILPQIVQVLKLINDRGFVHTSLTDFSIFLVSPTQVRVGSFWGCKPESVVLNDGITLSDILVGSISIRKRVDMISWFASFVDRITFLLERKQPVSKYIKSAVKSEKFSIFCPQVLIPLLEQCEKNSTSLDEILAFLQDKEFPPIVKMNSDFVAQHPPDISLEKGEHVLVISKTVFSDNHEPSKKFWLGEKDDGKIGFFDGRLTSSITPEEKPEGDKEGTDEIQIPAEITACGREAVNAYQRALKQGKVQVYRGRIMLIGQERAGKTSLKKSLLGLEFDPKEESTVGIDADPSCFCVDVDHVKNWRKEKDDKVENSFTDSIARIIVEDLNQNQVQNPEPASRNDSNQDLEEPQQEPIQDDIDQKVPSDVGDQVNKIQEFYKGSEGQNEDNEEEPTDSVPPDSKRSDGVDGVPEDVTASVIKYLQELKLEDSSSAQELMITIWDFAGQHLYYASHPVFFSPRAVYVLVYNLSKDLTAPAEPCVRQGAFDVMLENPDKQTNLEAILSWLVSIHSARPGNEGEETKPKKTPYMRPPVIVVGTHIDHPWDKRAKMETLIKKSLTGKSYQQHVIKPFIAVNNTLSSTDEGVQKLQQKVLEVLGMEPYMGEHIPVRWLSFEKVIKRLVKEGTNHLPLKELQMIIFEVCYIEEETEIEAMLNFYHDLGVIVRHGSTVVLQAQWLIDLFRKLITIRPFDEQNSLYEEHWSTLEESGVLHMDLVEHVFGNLIDSDQTKEDLLAMMEHYGLVARFTIKDSESLDYFVPAQLKSSPEQLLDVEPSLTDPCTLYVHFLDGFIPHGVYYCLVSKLIAWCSVKGYPHEPNLYRSASRFIIGNSSEFDLFLICRKRFVKVILRSLQTKNSCNFQPAVEIKGILESALKDISTECLWYQSLHYNICVLCPSCSKVKQKCHKHQVESCIDEDCIHLLPVTDDQVLVCTKTFNQNSRPFVLGLKEWYRQENKIVPIAAGSVSSDKLICLASDIGSKWKAFGRAIGLEEPDLDEIEADEEEPYERSYGVLKKWSQIQGSSAAYEHLVSGLLHPSVQLDNLVTKHFGMIASNLQVGAEPPCPSDQTLPKVFLSYQWDIQSTALEIASRLKEKGVDCWVDIGQMGGGDSLYAEIDKGIRAAKVFVCCVTSKYSQSENCQKEATLADTIKKPVIPLLLENISWPPEGQLGPIFAKLLYIDMIQGYEDKIDELVKRVNTIIKS